MNTEAHSVRNAAGLFLTRSIKGAMKWDGAAFAYSFTREAAEKLATEMGGEVVNAPRWNATTKAYEC